MKIAVTGSAGFVGSKLIKKLIELNHEVLEIDLFNGYDLVDEKTLENIPCFDSIFHLAAFNFVPDSYINPKKFYFNNYNSTLNVLELCKKYNARIIYASSYVYGKPRYLPIDEKHPLKSFNPYADTKIICEQLINSYNKFFDVKAIIVRPFNIYGPNQSEKFLIPLILKQAKTGRILLQDSSPRRDFIYIDDLIEFYLKLLNYTKSIDVFNAGFGKSISVKEITDIVNELFNHSLNINFSEEKRINEIADTVADITKANNLLNWYPAISFIDGIKKILEH